ncbi:MAG: hypothetical protein ACRDRA_12000 [Pseudonocardiaceae bacterium]
MGGASVMMDTASWVGLSPELLTALALRRALGGGLAKAGEIYVDYGYPVATYLTNTFTELIDCGLLKLADNENSGLRRVTITSAGRVRYLQVYGVLRPGPR